MNKTVIGRDQIHLVATPTLVIWRPLFCYNGVMMQDLHRITPRISGDDPTFRIRLCGEFNDICEPCIDPHGRGLTCFLKAELPEQWTHLVVTGVAKSGNAVMAIPECLPDIPAYIAWRLKIATLFNAPNSAEEQVAEEVRYAACPGLRVDRTRKQIFMSEDRNFVVYED